MEKRVRPLAEQLGCDFLIDCDVSDMANLDRALKLVAKGFISKADMDRKRATRDAANARVRVAQAQHAEAQARNGRLNIVAPAAGLVLERRVEPGQIVSAGSGVLFRLAKGGEIVLAGFYSERVSFAFPAAFMREAHFRVAAEWQPGDLAETRSLIECGRLDLTGLVTNRRPAGEALDAYPQAFSDPDCLKMVLDWSEC